MCKSRAKPSTILKLAMTYLLPEQHEESEHHHNDEYFYDPRIMLLCTRWEKYKHLEFARMYLDIVLDESERCEPNRLQRDRFLAMCFAYELAKSEGN